MGIANLLGEIKGTFRNFKLTVFRGLLLYEVRQFSLKVSGRNCPVQVQVSLHSLLFP
jgi:hypothetical protein